MAKDLNRSIKIFIDNSDAMKKSKELETRMAALRQRLQDLHAQGEKGSPEYIRTEKTLRQLSASYGRYQDKLKETERILKNLSGATEAQLLAVRKQLRQDLKNTIRDTDEYRSKLQALIAVEKELSTVEKEQSSTMGRKGSMWSSMADGFNKYFGIVTSIIAGITGVSYTLRKLAEDVAQMDDVYADVMKTTGMTRDEVLDLNETFKQMDTRTARDEINLLARDAGKLGLTSRKDILDFVEAGNQINVSLGEDLGEGAIKNIGKMTDVYALSTKELEKLDLKGKMLAIGSAINELGATSTASEAYMVNFTQRLGGVASQAGISIQNILGYASALDQSGQAVEMSATALQKFIMTLMGDPAKFAKIAGLEVKSFNQLLKTDTNEAIKQVLTALSNKGGFQALIPIFKDMGLDGARAVGVLSALATNIDKVNAAQEVSNKAFSDGTSISDEYNIKNNNLQAQLEKSRKAFKDAALELGEKLSPALLTSTKWTTYLIKLLPTFVDWFVKYKSVIISAAAGIITYTIALNKSIIVSKLTVLWNERVLQSNLLLIAKEKIHTAVVGLSTLATYAKGVAHDVLTKKITLTTAANEFFRLSLAKTPWGLVIALITAAGVAFYQYATRIKETISTAQKLNDVVNEANRSIASEKTELTLLLNVAKNEKISKEERIKAIKRLNEISPEYLGNLNLENINTIETTKSIEAYTDALLKNAKAKAIQGSLEKEYTRLNEIRLEKEKIEEDAIKAAEKRKKYEKFGGLVTVDTDPGADDRKENALNKLKEEEEQINNNIDAYQEFYNELLEKKDVSFSAEEELAINKKSFDDIEQSYANLNAEIEKNKKSPFYSNFQKSGDEIRLKLLGEQVNKQRELYQAKEKDLAISKKSKEFMLLSEAELKKLIAANGEYADLASKIYKQRFSTDETTSPSGGTTKASEQKKALDLIMESLETKHQEKLLDIKLKYRSGEISSESEYNQKLFAQEQAYSILKEHTLENYLAKIKDKELKSDVTKQLAVLKTKRLDDEISFRAKLQKIILDANPLEKEKQAYQERLSALGLFGESAESLRLQMAASESESEKLQLQQKFDAFLLLEKQYQENVRKIKKDGKAKEKADSEAYFLYGDDTDENQGFQKRKDKMQTELGKLQLQAAANPTFDTEMAVHIQMLNMIQEEINARKTLGITFSKQEADKIKIQQKVTESCRKEVDKQIAIAQGYADTFGNTMGNVISGQENLLTGFSSMAIDIMFDVLSKIIEASIVRIAATSTETMAAAQMQALATPDSVMTFGASGAIRAAIMAGLITAAAVTAKSALKGMLGKKSGSSSSSTSDSAKSSGRVTVKQRAKGNYNVIGEEDNKLYSNIPYTGIAQTGVVSKPVLVGEQGSELIVSAPDLKALQKHINYPLIMQAIQDARHGTVPQRRSGNYTNVDSSNTNPFFSAGMDPAILNNLAKAIDAFNQKDMKVNLGITELQAEMKKVNEENNRFSKK